MKPAEQMEWTVRLLRYCAGQSSPDEALEVYRSIQKSDELRRQMIAIQTISENFDDAWTRFARNADSETTPIRLGIRGALDEARKVAIAFARPFTEQQAETYGPSLALSGAGVAGPDSYASIRREEAEIRSNAIQTEDLLAGLDSMLPLVQRVPDLEKEICWDLEWNGRSVGEFRVFPTDGQAIVRVHQPGTWAVLLHSTQGWESHELETRDGIDGVLAEFKLPSGPFDLQLIESA